MQEKRQLVRLRVFKSAKIHFSGGLIDCTVRNLSEKGAALDVETPVGIPDRFTLLIATDQLKVDCLIIWRNIKRVGVAFVPIATCQAPPLADVEIQFVPSRAK